MSFGYRAGDVPQADLVVDLRAVPLPVPGTLGAHGDGTAPEIVQSLHRCETFASIVEQVSRFSANNPEAEIAVGCREGQYQSVALIESVADILYALGFDPIVEHRDRKET